MLLEAQNRREMAHFIVPGPIESNAEVGPAFAFAICCENSDAMLELTGISRP